MTQSMDSFSSLGLPQPLLAALADVGYETPSPIQAACIPPLLAGHDLLGEAQTGTGKTAAFALPLLARLDLALRRPQALVLTPTRELAIQVAEACQKYAHHLPGFHILPVYGGQSMVVQLRALSRGAHVIVGTPGRVMDHLERKSLSLDALKVLVLDEADEMLRMGFIDDVEWILNHTPRERQTALFSATMPDQIRRVARKHLRDPKEVKIRATTSTVATTRQRYWLARGADKLEALTRILEVEADFDAALVFVRTKTTTANLAQKLEARGYAAAALSGDLAQNQREAVIGRLKSGNLDIVVATDVAARGIDVSRISHVINYDIPYDTEAYIHRIGRTGRAGRTGSAILFVEPREMRMLQVIERATRQKIEPMTLPSRNEVTGQRVVRFRQKIQKILETEKLDFMFEVVHQMEEEQALNARQIAAALAFLVQKDRPLQPPAHADVAERVAAPAHRVASHTTPRTEHGAVRGARPERSSERSAGAGHPAPAGGFGTYRIEVGRSHGATPKEIVGAIANEGGIMGKHIGAIRLFDDHSTVELPAHLAPNVLGTLRKTRVCQRPLGIALLTGEQPARASAGAHRGKPPHRDSGKKFRKP